MIAVRRFASVIPLVLATTLAPTRASAALLPSFDADALAWSADEIVTASEEGTLDGRLRVAATLTGTLRAGDVLVIPELARFAPPSMRRVDCTAMPAPCAPIVTGDRVVLFLSRIGPNSYAPASSAWRRTRSYSPAVPSATDPDGYIVSVAWIEHGDAYAYRQFMNPGPQILARVEPEATMRVEIANMIARRAVFGAAMAETDANRRARALFRFLATMRDEGTSRLGEREALEAIEHLGPASLPALRAMMEEPAMRDRRADLLRTMARAGGSAAVPDLVSVVTREWGFWSVRAPTLQVGWWNGTGIAWSEVEALRDRYMELYAALTALAPIHVREARGPVERLRALWVSYPALDDRTGLHQMVEACDEVIAGTPSPRAAP